MTRILFVLFFVISCLCATAQKATIPLVDSTLIFGSKNGLIVVEAEHFYKQSKNDIRAWYINSPQHHPQVWPDHDTASYADASGLAYIEALPDLFHTEEDPIINGENLGSDGNVAVVHYKVFFTEAGRYYLWTRLRSNDEEDNTTQAGINGIWPASAKILQSPVNKKKWIWKNDNRISRNPWKIGRAYLDISSPGIHDVQFGMREDGEEFDKFLLTADSLYRIIEDPGPPATVIKGKLPQTFSTAEITAHVYHGLQNPDGSVYGANVLYGDTAGKIFFEAENFYRQTKTQERMWYLVAPASSFSIGPDSDEPHLAGASDNAYLELLPDARQKDEDAINSKTSIKGLGGQAAIVSYMVDFPTAGTYYVWVRGIAIDGDDNTLHVGINHQWPESGKKLMFNGKQWKWSNTQRDTKAKIAVDVPAMGRHEFMLSMREDGCEIDAVLLTADSIYKPGDTSAFIIKIKKGNSNNWYHNRLQWMRPETVFKETNGIVMMESEAVPSTDGWSYFADSSGHSGFGYYEWNKPGQGIPPGTGLLTYTFQINEPGNYQLFIRGKMKDPNNRPETPDADGNDIWVKINGGTDALNAAALHSGWNKIAILGHPVGWTWNTNYDKEKSHPVTPVCRYFDKGLYSITLSGRSAGYAIDSLLLTKYKKKPVVDFDAYKIPAQQTQSLRIRK